MPDVTCMLASLFVFVGNLLLAIWAGIERSQPTFDWEAYRTLEPSFLKEHWEDRRDLTGLHIAGSFIIAVSWVVLTIPFIQVAFLLSNGGTRKLWLHSMIVVLCVSASTTEFVARLMHVGSWNTGNWISTDFYLEDWAGNPNTPNGIGWKVLEIAYQLSQGTILWVDGWEYFALFGIGFSIFLSVRTSKGGLLGEELCWAGMGLFIGLLSLADFVFLILRFKNWDTYNLVSILMTIMIRLIFLPCWILLLAFKLPPAVQEYSDSKRASSLTQPLTPRSPSAPPLTSFVPSPEHFTIED